jgi:hypothetical protein
VPRPWFEGICLYILPGIKEDLVRAMFGTGAGGLSVDVDLMATPSHALGCGYSSVGICTRSVDQTISGFPSRAQDRGSSVVDLTAWKSSHRMLQESLAVKNTP